MGQIAANLECAYDLLEADLRRGGVAVLCGSGISVSPPSCVPSGREIAGAFQRTIEAAITNAGLERIANWGFVSNMMPERIISAFYAAFGWAVFEFMDAWFDKDPNPNHHALARLVASKRVSRVITLNFDFLLEVAWREVQRSDIRLATPPLESRGENLEAWLYKPHGSLDPGKRDATERDRYGNVLFTIERIGTALDDRLVDRLEDIIGSRPLLVTGYSAGDLDIFPALREARERAVRVDDGAVGRVYWNYRDPVKLSATPGLEGWLQSLKPRWCPLPGEIEKHLSALLPRAGLKVNPIDSGRDEYSGPRLETLGRLERDDQGVLLAAALVMHAGNQSDQHRVEGAVLRNLRPYYEKWIEAGDYRKATMFAQLTADRCLEQGNHSTAARWYAQAALNVATHQEPEAIAAEVTPDQIRCKLAHAQLRPLRSLSPMFHLVTVPNALFALWRTARGRTSAKPDTQRLASHFLGDLFYTLGMQFEAVFLMRRMAVALYRRALMAFEFSIEPHSEWRARDVFHHLRVDEVRLLLYRSRCSACGLLSEEALSLWDHRFKYYEYVAEVLKDDVHLAGAVHCVAALRDVTGGVPSAANTRVPLEKASELYRTREYGAGVIRLQMYVWLCAPRPNSCVLLVMAKRAWRLLALRICPCGRAAHRLWGDIEELPGIEGTPSEVA